MWLARGPCTRRPLPDRDTLWQRVRWLIRPTSPSCPLPLARDRDGVAGPTGTLDPTVSPASLQPSRARFRRHARVATAPWTGHWGMPASRTCARASRTAPCLRRIACSSPSRQQAGSPAVPHRRCRRQPSTPMRPSPSYSWSGHGFAKQTPLRNVYPIRRKNGPVSWPKNRRNPRKRRNPPDPTPIMRCKGPPSRRDPPSCPRQLPTTTAVIRRLRGRRLKPDADSNPTVRQRHLRFHVALSSAHGDPWGDMRVHSGHTFRKDGYYTLGPG